MEKDVPSTSAPIVRCRHYYDNQLVGFRDVLASGHPSVATWTRLLLGCTGLAYKTVPRPYHDRNDLLDRVCAFLGVGVGDLLVYVPADQAGAER